MCSVSLSFEKWVGRVVFARSAVGIGLRKREECGVQTDCLCKWTGWGVNGI